MYLMNSLRVQAAIIVFLNFLFQGCATVGTQSKGVSIMSPYILEANEEQLRSAQAKITYLGTQEKPIPTVVFASQGHNLAMQDFLPVQKTAQPYANDESPYVLSFTVGPFEFRRMLLAVEPICTEESQPSRILSFTVVLVEASHIEGQEFFITSNNSQAFYQELLKALDAGNEKGRSALLRQFRAVSPPQPEK